MQTVYLDQQIVISSFDGGEVAAAIEAGKSKGIIFPYSPAHVEEIAAAHHRHKREDALAQIPALDRLSGGWAIMARRLGPAELIQESIYDCLARVQDNGARLLTEIVVEMEKARVAGYHENVSDRDKNEVWASVQRCTPQNVFSNPNIHAYIDKIAREDGFRIRLETHQDRENTLENLFNILNYFGFQKVDTALRIEGRIHDVSHAIYGSYADVFVTNDKKLRKSSEAIYSYTGIDVRIVDLNGFLDLAETWKS